MTTVTPKFDPNDTKLRSRATGGAHVEPILPVEVAVDGRSTIVWVIPSPGGGAGWHHEVLHRTGPWPLLPEGRNELEKWFDEFASAKWPQRVQVFPADFRPRG